MTSKEKKNFGNFFFWNLRVCGDIMTPGFIGQANNYILSTYLYRIGNIVLKFWKLMKNIFVICQIYVKICQKSKKY